MKMFRLFLAGTVDVAMILFAVLFMVGYSWNLGWRYALAALMPFVIWTSVKNLWARFLGVSPESSTRTKVSTERQVLYESKAHSPEGDSDILTIALEERRAYRVTGGPHKGKTGYYVQMAKGSDGEYVAQLDIAELDMDPDSSTQSDLIYPSLFHLEPLPIKDYPHYTPSKLGLSLLKKEEDNER
jgi:hypothetical protein